MTSLYTLSILTGLFIGTSYIPFPPWAVLFGIAPLMIAWWRIATDQISEKNSDTDPSQNIRLATLRAFALGWISQFILNAIGFHWIAQTAIEFGHFPMWGGLLVLFAFCSLAHLYYPVAGALTVFIYRKLRARGVAMSAPMFMALAISVFALAESIWPSIFPWHLGYTWLWARFPGFQFADVIGFEGLNLVSLAANALFAIGWSVCASFGTRLERLKPSFKWVGAAIALFLVINVAGLGREKRWQETNRELKLLIVQGNIGNFEKMMVEHDKNFATPIINIYSKLTVQGLDANPGTQFVLWPETAFPSYLDMPYRASADWVSLAQLANIRNVTILTGAYSYDQQKKETYNGFFAMSPQMQIQGEPYRKSILIPFGEQFPFSDVIPYMKWLFPGLGAFGAGAGPMAMDLNGMKLGPQICLESLYPRFTAKASLLGAEVFSNVTNDSWFGRTFEPYQHMTMTLARAIENRRPLLRATNTGITTVVLADGTVLERSEIDKEWFGAYNVPYIANPPIVPYSYIAGYSPWLALLIAMLILGRALGTKSRDA